MTAKLHHGPRWQVLRLLAACSFVLVSTTSFAQWQVRSLNPQEEGGKTFSAAVITAASGHRLAIFLDDRSVVMAQLALGPGLTTMEPEGCPTYRIDEGKPVSALSASGGCSIGERSVRFDLGTLQGKRIRSSRLLNIMNGSRLKFVFRLRALGYATAEFSLRGSKQAINRVLGEKVTVVGE